MCGYPDWAFKESNKKPKPKDKKSSDTKSRKMVVLPYKEGLSQRVQRTFNKFGVATAFKPHKTLRNYLVKPKDKRDVLHTAECVYEIPCLNCDKSYIGETARIFDKRLNEHKGEAEKASAKPFTRAQRMASVTGEQNKSALTDHVAEENHAIGWKSAKIRDREPNKRKRLIKESIWIRKKGGQTLNRDLGNYFLPNIYDQLLCERQPTAPPTIAKNKRQSAKFGH